jgi:hypothetical protein
MELGHVMQQSDGFWGRQGWGGVGLLHWYKNISCKGL